MHRTRDWMKELKSFPRRGIDVDERSGEALTALERSQRVQELFETNNSALMRFLTGKLKSVQEAKEVAQEAYVRVLQLDTANGMSHMQSFLFKTAGNLAANRVKSARRRERIDTIEFFGETDVAPSPEDEVAAEQVMEQLIASIQELPAKCRFAFVMHRFHGHELEDVAQLMKISERMVRIYIERAATFCHEQLVLTGGGR
ncbi:MAG: RNA polymerase sigma factor [Candidatus Angelobacter sp.]